MFSSSVGLATGINWAAMINQIIELESQPIRLRQTQIQQAEGASRAWKDFDKHLTKLRDLNTEFRFGRSFQAVTATVGETASGVTAMTASATAGAPSGTWNVRVVSLAKAETVASSSVADPEAALGLDGDFSLGGVTIEVEASDSLNEIRRKINDSGASVSASVMKISESEHRLVLKSTTTGSAGVGYADGTDSVGAALGLAVSVAGADATVEIDGTTVTRSSNTFDDVLEGISFTLQAETGVETFEFTAGQDNDNLVAKTKEWVEAYNEVVKFITSQTRSGEGTTPGALKRNGSLLRMASNLLREATGTDLWTIGIERERNGQLKMDETAFLAAVEADRFQVESHLQNTIAVQVENTLLELSANADSLVNNATKSMETRINSLKQQQDRWEARLEVRRTQLTKQFNTVEKMISELNSQATGLTGFMAGLNQQV